MSLSNREIFERNLVLAKQGNSSAMLDVSASYMLGAGVLVNLKESFGWCQESAHAGNKIAQLFLGYMLLYGLGTTQNKPQADVWFSRAASEIERSAEVQKGLVKYGFIKEVCADGHDVLYKRQVNGADRAAWLSVIDGTGSGKRRFIAVPSNINSAAEALTWHRSRSYSS